MTGYDVPLAWIQLTWLQHFNEGGARNHDGVNVDRVNKLSRFGIGSTSSATVDGGLRRDVIWM
jgi:hypothetical protein